MLHLAAALDKIQFVESMTALPSARAELPDLPARDVPVVDVRLMPGRPGFNSTAGQIRVLHDLGNIELQAMELCYRGLIEYPDAPEEFRMQLFELLKSEAGHFKLCLSGLQDLGGQWGDHPVHLGLWSAVRPSDSLLDRILIVHRYLEGNGLDAGNGLQRRLTSIPRNVTHLIIDQIAREEIEHVSFGSLWYKNLCRLEKLDPEDDFKTRFGKLLPQIPRRIQHIHHELRRKSGFSENEIQFLEDMRASWMPRATEDNKRTGQKNAAKILTTEKLRSPLRSAICPRAEDPV